MAADASPAERMSHLVRVTTCKGRNTESFIASILYPRDQHEPFPVDDPTKAYLQGCQPTVIWGKLPLEIFSQICLYLDPFWLWQLSHVSWDTFYFLSSDVGNWLWYKSMPPRAMFLSSLSYYRPELMTIGYMVREDICKTVAWSNGLRRHLPHWRPVYSLLQ